MTIKASTGLRNQVLDTASVKSILTGGFIKIYAGTPPATADDSLGSATLLTTITAAAGAGLTFGSAEAGVLPKNPAETWSGVNVAGGVAAFYRHVTAADTGAASTTQARVQGTISTAGGDMNITQGTTLANGATQNLNVYQLYLPTL